MPTSSENIVVNDDTERTADLFAQLDGLYKFGVLGDRPAETGGARSSDGTPSANKIFEQRLTGLIFPCSKDRFTDAFELQPLVVTPDLSPVEFAAEVKEIAARLRPLNALETRASIIARAKEKLLWQINCPQDFQENMWRELATCGIYSLTDSVKNLELWKQFADRGRGYVIRYEPDIFFSETIQHGTVLDVRYQESRPILVQNFSNSLDIDKCWFRPGLATKSKSYHGEREWRLVTRHICNRELQLNPKVITDVFFGWAIPVQEVESLTKKVSIIAPHTAVHRVDQLGHFLRKDI